MVSGGEQGCSMLQWELLNYPSGFGALMQERGTWTRSIFAVPSPRSCFRHPGPC